MNQSGWQYAAVGEPVRAITHVELGQDLDGLADNGKGEILEDSIKQQLLPSLFVFSVKKIWKRERLGGMSKYCILT